MFCPNCGKQVNDSDNFCKYCGKDLRDEFTEKKNTLPSNQTEEVI